jgi:hypothetical protein
MERNQAQQQKTERLSGERLEMLNALLGGRTILSVEPGTTYGWVVINLVPKSDESRIFLTIQVGEEPMTDEAHHSSEAAIHSKGDGSTWIYAFRPLTPKL